MKEAERKEAVTLGSACGLIWVDDTSTAGCRTKLQKSFDVMGDILPKFTVRSFVPFEGLPRDRWGVPPGCRLIEHYCEDPSGYWRYQKGDSMNR